MLIFIFLKGSVCSLLWWMDVMFYSYRNVLVPLFLTWESSWETFKTMCHAPNLPRSLSVQTQTLIESTVVTGLLRFRPKTTKEAAFSVCDRGRRSPRWAPLLADAVVLAAGVSVGHGAAGASLLLAMGHGVALGARGGLREDKVFRTLHRVAPCYTRVSCYGHMLAPVDRFRAPRVMLTGFI